MPAGSSSTDKDNDDELARRTNHDVNRATSEPGSKSGNNGSIFAFRPSKDVKKFAKKYRTEISASSSSILSTFIAFPLDFAKSRMQSYEGGFIHTVKDAYKAEGLRAFWRGVGPPMVSVTVVRTISFSIYQKAKYFLDRNIARATGQSPLVIANAPGSWPNIYTMTCFGAAGAVSGAVITTLSCPFELTKLSEQLAGKMAREAKAADGGSRNRVNPSSTMDVKTGSWNTARRLVRDRGLRGLYAGYRLHLLRDTTGTAIYFTTYESVKQLMANARGRNPTSPNAVLVAGGLCGIVSWACVSLCICRSLELILSSLFAHLADVLVDLSDRRCEDVVSEVIARSWNGTADQATNYFLQSRRIQR